MTPLPATMRGSSSTSRSGRRVLRGLGRTLAALVGLIVVLGLVGAIYESAASNDGGARGKRGLLRRISLWMHGMRAMLPGGESFGA